MAQLLRKTEDGREIYASSAPIEIKAVDVEEGIYSITISTESVDREGDVMRAAGVQFDRYMQNPVVLFAHDYRSPPIGTTLDIDIGERGIAAEFRFLPWGTYDFADVIHRIWDAGALRTSSVGFISLKTEPVEGDKGGRDIQEWELLEWSIVPVPMNPEALRRALWDADDFWEPAGQKPYPNEHACRLRDPGDFQPNSFRRTSREHEGKKYAVITGRLKEETTMTEQAYRYPKEIWTAAEARSHCKEHNGSFAAATQEASWTPKQLDECFVLPIEEKFAGSPKNRFGTHSSYKFKGNYAAAWRCHFSKVGGGGTSGAATGPIRGTVRRTEMIAATMKPPCNLPSTDSIGPRTGPKSPLNCSFPSSPGDYGLSSWAEPETDADREGMKLSCSDLAVIKRAALAEIKRRAEDRDKGRDWYGNLTEEEKAFFDTSADASLQLTHDDAHDTGDVEPDNKLTEAEANELVTALREMIQEIKEVLLP